MKYYRCVQLPSGRVLYYGPFDTFDEVTSETWFCEEDFCPFKFFIEEVSVDES